MQIQSRKISAGALRIIAALLLPASVVLAQGGAGGGGGGGTKVLATPDVFPNTAPPGYLYRDSFGFGVDWFSPQRPTGKGVMRLVDPSRPLQGYWIEYPGSTATAWVSGDTVQAWRFAGCGKENPNEPPSLLQPPAPGGTPSNACVQAQVIDVGVNTHPSALVPFTAPKGGFQVSVDAQPAPTGGGAYIAVGLTSSSVANSNLATVGSLWMLLLPGVVDPVTGVIGPLRYELRLTGQSGPLLAAGETVDIGWNQIAVGFDPVTQSVHGVVNGGLVGPFAITPTQASAITSAKFVGFEGEGLADNFAVTAVP